MPVIQHYEKLGKVAEVRPKSSLAFTLSNTYVRSIAPQQWMKSTQQLSLLWRRFSFRFPMMTTSGVTAAKFQGETRILYSIFVCFPGSSTRAFSRVGPPDVSLSLSLIPSLKEAINSKPLIFRFLLSICQKTAALPNWSADPNPAD